MGSDEKGTKKVDKMWSDEMGFYQIRSNRKNSVAKRKLLLNNVNQAENHKHIKSSIFFTKWQMMHT